MYLNILLKRKTEQTHNFPYNGSTDIKTDKEHIHRGFKDHKGLSYAFNGVNYSIDNKKVYQGHTKNYSPTAFNYNRNYDREYFNKFNIHPKTRPIELYTEYKNRYPNLSPNQYSIEMWQTERGTPNELNRVMRQDKTGKSLEEIEADDNDYAQGLATLEQKIKNRKNQEIKNIDEDSSLNDIQKEEQKKQIYDLSKKEIKKYIKQNPVRKFAAANKPKNVVIKPAIIKPAESSGVEESKPHFNNDKGNEWARQFDEKNKQAEIQKAKDVHHTFENVFNTVQNLDKTITEKVNNKKNATQPPVKSGGDSTQPTVITLKPTSPPPPREAVAKAVAKNSEKETKQLESVDDDDKTVNNDTYNVSDTLKPSFIEAHKILDKFKGQKEAYNIKTNNPTDFVKLNELCDKVLNKPKGTNQWATYRKLSDVLHYGQALEYVKAPSKAPSKK